LHLQAREPPVPARALGNHSRRPSLDLDQGGWCCLPIGYFGLSGTGISPGEAAFLPEQTPLLDLCLALEATADRLPAAIRDAQTLVAKLRVQDALRLTVLRAGLVYGQQYEAT
jgi:hypothetical protein